MAFNNIKIVGNGSALTAITNTVNTESVVNSLVAYNITDEELIFSLIIDEEEVVIEKVSANSSFRLVDKLNVPTDTTLSVEAPIGINVTVSYFQQTIDTSAALTVVGELAAETAANANIATEVNDNLESLQTNNKTVKQNIDTITSDEVSTQLANAEANAENAQTAADTALATANYKGLWSGLTGGLNKPASVSYDDKIWALNVDLTDVTASEPTVENADWQLVGTSGDAILIVQPTITSPVNGTTDFIGEVVASAYEISENYNGSQDVAYWEASTDSGFGTIVDNYSGNANLISWTPSIGMSLTQVWVRVRHGSDNHLSDWSDSISFTTPDTYIETPTVSVTGSPDDVGETPTISTSDFSVYNGSDTHTSTDWEVRLSSDDSLVWSSETDTTNLLSIDVPSGELEVDTEYVFKAKHNGDTYGSSAFGSVDGTTKSAFAIPIGTPGTLGFSVAPTSEPFAALGLAELTGTNTVGSDEYGNYIHTNGSIVCWMPKGYYRIGNASAAQYDTYGDNTLEIVGTETYSTEVDANADGFILHRAFIDGGVEKAGFFIDKYINSKSSDDANTAVSVKDGNPIGLTTNADYTPSSTMTDCTGILADSITLSRARGDGWNVQSIFIGAWIMMTSVAQGQNATGTTDVAWYDSELTTNFPKGCNSSLSDTNDDTVSYTESPDNAAKGLTGSGTPFAKTTHNGSNNGVADVNGLMYQPALGMTNAGTSDTDTTQNTTDDVYVLKTSSFLKDLTAGWDTSTDAFGNTTHLDSLYDKVTAPMAIGSSIGWVYWGSGTSAVFSNSTTGVSRDLCGFIPKDDAGADDTGVNMLGNDGIYKYNRANQFPLLSGYWSTAATAGVGCRGFSTYRSNDRLNAGVRAVAYV